MNVDKNLRLKRGNETRVCFGVVIDQRRCIRCTRDPALADRKFIVMY